MAKKYLQRIESASWDVLRKLDGCGALVKTSVDWQTVSRVDVENPGYFHSPQTLKYPCAPQTRPAGDISDVAVLLEIIGLYIVAWCQAAAGAGRVIVGQHVRAK